MSGPIDQMRLEARISLLRVLPLYSREPVSESVGNQAVSATPICALAAATLRSASATSGRLSSSCEGIPGGTVGTSARMGAALCENPEGLWPISTAMACSSVALGI